jgi:hypothetical protein
MGLERFFIDHRLPRQFMHVGNGYVDLYRLEGRELKKIQSHQDVTLTETTGEDFEKICAPLSRVSTGLVLNSGFFIFNIFEFQRLPLLEGRLKDLINWKVKKVFPEDLELYHHGFFHLDRRRIFSILIRRELVHRLSELFHRSGRPLTFLGNSTVEIMNRLFTGRVKPDLFVEIDNGLISAGFQNKSVPFYIRKFRVAQVGELAEEIAKTLDFVSKNNGYSPGTFSLVPLAGNGFRDTIEAELEKRDMKKIPVHTPEKLIIPSP